MFINYIVSKQLWDFMELTFFLELFQLASEPVMERDLFFLVALVNDVCGEI